VAREDGCWRVNFYDFTTLCGKLDGELARFGDVHERARRNGARHGTPVLRDDTELPREVLVAMLTASQRGRGEQEAPGGVTGYADTEMQLIMTALRRDVRTARDRISAGRELLASYRSDPSRLSAEDQRAGRILDVFEATGDMPRYPGGALLGLVTRAGGVVRC
jgi:hypothetical protein